MDTPVFQQLTGLLTVIKAGLRADAQLTGSESGQMEYTADEVCKTIYPHKMFEVQDDGIVPYVKLGKANCPALAIWVERAEPTADVGGADGMQCDIGLQYAFETRARDVANQAFAAHFSMAIWWAIFKIVFDNWRTAAGSLRTTYHIEEMALSDMRLLPPFSQAVRAFEASGSLDFKRPMWDTGADSSQVIDLASIYTDYDEDSDVGGDPQAQSIHEP